MNERFVDSGVKKANSHVSHCLSVLLLHCFPRNKGRNSASAVIFKGNNV